MTLGTVVDWIHDNWASITVIGTILALVVKLTHKIDKFSDTIEETNKIIKKEIPAIKEEQAAQKKKLEEVDAYIREDKEHREDSQQRSMLICKGVTASLKGLQEIGANGPTHDALGELEEYMLKKTVK